MEHELRARQPIFCMAGVPRPAHPHHLAARQACQIFSALTFKPNFLPRLKILPLGRWGLRGERGCMFGIQPARQRHEGAWRHGHRQEGIHGQHNILGARLVRSVMFGRIHCPAGRSGDKLAPHISHFNHVWQNNPRHHFQLAPGIRMHMAKGEARIQP